MTDKQMLEEIIRLKGDCSKIEAIIACSDCPIVCRCDIVRPMRNQRVKEATKMLKQVEKKMCRIIKVNNCRKCPYRSTVQFRFNGSPVCDKYRRSIPKMPKEQMFPDFCQLEELEK